METNKLILLQNILKQNEINKEKNKTTPIFSMSGEPIQCFTISYRESVPGTIAYLANPLKVAIEITDEEVKLILDKKLKEIDLEAEYNRELEQLKKKYGK